MGTFNGHVAPGILFIWISIWWIINILRRHFRSQFSLGPKYKSTLTFSLGIVCNRLDRYEGEGFFKLTMCCLGIVAQMYAGYTDYQVGLIGLYLKNGQHSLMYFFYGLSGLVDILIFKGVPLPHEFEYFTIIIACIVQGRYLSSIPFKFMSSNFKGQYLD